MSLLFHNSKHLIIGAGEVGDSLYKVLSAHYRVAIRDIKDEVKGKFDVLHICYPWIKGKVFIQTAKKYIKEYKPKLIIIHSTVPLGTTRQLSSFAVHSPIRGMHPELESGIRTFVKYFGGKKAKEAAKIFSALGIQTRTFKKSETTEFLKILDTTYYGWNIVFGKEVKRICDEYRLDFDEVYTIPNNDYNEGYKKLGKPNVVRPVLKVVSGKIGGHCVIQNCDLLKDWITDTIKKRNDRYE